MEPNGTATGGPAPADWRTPLLDPADIAGRTGTIESYHAPGCGLYCLPPAPGDDMPGVPVEAVRTAACTCGRA